MNLRFVASCALVCAVLVLSGCDQGRKAPGKVTVQVANAASGFGSLSFEREHDDNNRSELQFKDAAAYYYDADTYDFFVLEPTFKVEDPGENWTFTQKLEKETHYTFVLTEVAGEIEPVVIPNPAPPTGSNAQILGLHAARGLPAMDLYLESPGVGIAGATPRGTFNVQEQIAPLTLPGGDYELFLTAAGNPADVLLTSQQFNLPAGTTSTFVVVDENGTGTARINALLLQGGASTILFDRNAPSALSAINGATDRMPRDVAVDSQFSPPTFSAIAFGEPTPYAQVPVGYMQINVTPVGNPGVLELGTQLVGTIGQRATMLFSGPAGTLIPVFAADDGRRFDREAKVRFMNVASQFIGIDFYVTLPDGDPGNLFPIASLYAPGISTYVTLHPGDYDLYLREGGTFTTVMGPTRFHVDAAGIYGILAIDGPDTATADLLYLDDFP